MGPIKCRIFRRTIPALADPRQAIDDAAGELTTECNAFLATLPAADVADIKTHVAAVGKYGEFTHYTITVYYLSEA